jgi:hypothetical protein
VKITFSVLNAFVMLIESAVEQVSIIRSRR